MLDVVLMGRTHLLGPLRRFGALDKKRACEALDEIGVGELAERPLYALSGGQHQRVLIARAIAAEPELLVLDEPTSAMDPAAERVLLELVERLKHAHDLSVVLVTHRTSLLAMVSRVIVIDGGKIVADGPRDRIMEALTSGRIARAA